jgi:NAD(P)-dependent dehydrogenase (short-subunit alcohol dehydrogenase family)
MARRAEAVGDLPSIDAIAARTPVRRAGTPDDVAAACMFLCSDEAGYITGHVLNVNGGMHLA